MMARFPWSPTPNCWSDSWYEKEIDSIGSVNYSNHTLRFQSYGTLTTDPSSHDLLLEKIGPVSFIKLVDNIYNYQNYFTIIPQHPLVIENFSLLCYSDHEITINFTAGLDSCSGRFVPRTNRIPKDIIKVIVQGEDLVIKSNIPIEKAEVYNLIGSQLHTQQIDHSQIITLRGITTNQTLLIVHITTKDNNTYTQKVIIQ